MINNLVFVSQAYLGFAGTQVLERAAEQARLSIVLETDEELHPRLVPYIATIHRLPGNSKHGLQPSFDVVDLTGVVRREIDAAGADPATVALFCQHEDNVLPVAHVRRLTGIRGDGPELVTQFRNKVAMKQAVAERLPHALPRYRKLLAERASEDPSGYYDELVGALGSERLIVKPTTGAGSLNVATVSSAEDLARAARQIRSDLRELEYEVDEYIDGTLYQCDSFVREGKVVFSGILELGCANFDFVQGRPLSVYPVTDEELYKELFAFNQEVVTTLGFQSGSTHLELFVRRGQGGTTSVTFLEIAARVPGGLGVPFHERNAGINLIDANIDLALGHDAKHESSVVRRNNVVSALLPVGHGRIIYLNEPDIMSAYSIDWRVKVGDMVDVRTLVDTAGILTLVNDDPVVLRRDFESLQGYTPVTCVAEVPPSCGVR
ncbi:ATP-grasp domain-containing protein [Streptomyces sp. NPDC005336]|uniref:ATP-grasp domain-containing protein n=1 Tax=unclassified Streptomyces TaxID=2593676 RepID=UPI0033A5C499